MGDGQTHLERGGQEHFSKKDQYAEHTFLTFNTTKAIILELLTLNTHRTNTKKIVLSDWHTHPHPPPHPHPHTHVLEIAVPQLISSGRKIYIDWRQSILHNKNTRAVLRGNCNYVCGFHI